MKKSLSVLGTVLLIGLFVVAAAPARAASTEERIKALEEELNRLKAEQQQVTEEQRQMQDDALAARSAAPEIRYRDGRGLSIRGADRSWEYRVGGKFQVHMAFFPDNDARSTFDQDADGPSQGSMVFRHIESPQYFRLLDGLYEFGYTFRADTSRGGQTKTERMQINFSRWSPYYPNVKINAIGPNTWSPILRVSSSSGYSYNRAPIFDGQFRTGSTKGLALEWDEVPLGAGTFNFNINYLSGNQTWNDKIVGDPTDQKGVIAGISIAPFNQNKGALQGLEMGVTYVNVHEDADRGSEIGIGTRSENNGVDIFEAEIDGRREYIQPWVDWAWGPVSLSAAYDKTDAEREDLGLPDVKLRTIAAGAGVYLYGPNGFFTGSRNRGLRLTYTHARNHFDQKVVGGDFDMRDWNMIENIVMLRWFQQSNLSYAVQYSAYDFNQFRGDLDDERRRLGISENGGTSQEITLSVLWDF